MGNRQSVEITRPQTEHDGKNVQNGEPNGHVISGSDSPDAVSFEVIVPQNSEPPAATQTNNTKPPPESTEANAKQVSAPVLSLEVSPEPEIPAESSTPAKEEAPKPVQTSSFLKIFKRRTETVAPTIETNVLVEEQVVTEVQTDGQMSEIDFICGDHDEIFEDDISVSLLPSDELDSEHMKVAEKLSLQLIASIQKSLPSKDITDVAPSSYNTSLTYPEALGASSVEEPVSVGKIDTVAKTTLSDPVETVSKETVSIIEEPELVTMVPGSTAKEKGATKNLQCDEKLVEEPEELQIENEVPAAKELSAHGVECLYGTNALQSLEEDTWVVIDGPNPEDYPAQLLYQLKSVCVEIVEDLPYNVIGTNVRAKKGSFYITTPVSSSMGKQGSELTTEAHEEHPRRNFLSREPPDIKESTQAEKEPQGKAQDCSSTENEEGSTQPEEIIPEENPVMNFFKTLVSPTKTTKEATAAPDASKEQSQKETPAASAANVQEALKVPPPPPPAPPKMESKAEPVVKKEEAPPAEAAAAAAAATKDQETPSKAKAKAKDSPFGKLFRPKALLGKVMSKVQAATASGASAPSKTSVASVVKEEAQPVEVQVDASKTSTLEAAAKPEPPPAPKPEEKKPEKKPSPFANLLKPKVLLGQVSSKIQAAASSAVASVSLATGGAAAEPKKEAPAVAEAAASAKVKEEPKPTSTAPVAAAVAPDNKSVGSADNASPSAPRKLEKRNSIQLFFKNLGQKRHSDAGVQTEAVAPEKTK